MVSKEHKRAALHEKLQLLRSVTHSNAHNKTSIIVDASKYIEELKQKVDRLNQEIAWARPKDDGNLKPMVNVETLQNGYLINVFLQKNCPGLLVSILEAFEELGLSMLEARAACTDTFRLEAVGGDDQFGSVNAQVVKQAVVRAIKNCSASNEQE